MAAASFAGCASSGELQNAMCAGEKGIFVEYRKVEGHYKGGCGNHVRQGPQNRCEIRDEEEIFAAKVEN